VKRIFCRISLLISLALLSGCAGSLLNSKELHRLDDVNALPRNARIGLTEFTVCGGNYLDKLAPENSVQDAKAILFRACTDLGHPKVFSARLRHRLEERLGRKMAVVRAPKTYKPKQVLHEADVTGLDYVIAGDLLFLGEKENKTVVTALFYLIRVADGKIVVVGRVKKDGEIGRVNRVINDVADELFARAYE